MLLIVLLAAWLISEVVLGVARRAKQVYARVSDRGSLVLLWVVISISVTSGACLQFVELGRMRLSPGTSRLVGLGLIVLGLVVRWSAILTLGRFFNTKVAIQVGHRIVRRGLYRSVRHPSYSGLLLAFAGLGVAFGNWLSFAAVLIPVVVAVVYRMEVEEGALVDTFGEQYVDYCQTTKRLIPWVY